MPAVPIPAWTTGYEVAEASLANRALARLGADLIRDTAEDTPVARQVRSVFATTRDELLRDYEFNFAKKYLELSEDGAYAAPKADWLYAYTVPTSPVILKLLEIDGDPESHYEIIGAGASRRLLCSIITTAGTPNKLVVKYVERIVDPASWDSLFQDALVLRVASKLAVPLVKRPDLAQALQGEFAAIITLAKRASSKERVIESGEPLWTDRTGTITS